MKYIIDNYTIILDNDSLTILKQSKKSSKIYVSELKIDYITKKYNITNSIKDLKNRVLESRKYPYDEEFLYMDKLDAFKSINKLLKEVKKLKSIDSILNIREIYTFLTLINEDNYYSVINDGVITLYSPSLYNKNNVFANLYIVLNSTKEVIGEISFNYFIDGFSYGGNVGYYIKKKFRNNHYATRALALLKRLLISNNFKGNKDLYLATHLENIQSQKVIENNNGKLIYEGKMANKDNKQDEKIRIYKININK